MDRWEAYRLRLERNEKQLLDLVKEVQEINPTVKAYRNTVDKTISMVLFIKDQFVNHVAFHDVPYRWSGCGYGESVESSHRGGDNISMPFTAKQVLGSFSHVTSKIYKSYGHRVKSYYKDVDQYMSVRKYMKLIE